ncbi:MAG TPA: O-antigen ligase family protein [Candidatus Paceibacterota bacterium]
MKNTKTSINVYTITDYLLVIVIFYSNMTYIPFFTKVSIVPIITYLLWVLLFVSLLKSFAKIQSSSLMIISVVLIFDTYIMLMEILSKNPYITSRFVYPVNLCLFVFLIGQAVGKKINAKKLKLFARSYIYSAMILGIFIYLNYFRGVNWVDSTSYIVIQKNGITLIFVISIIFLLFAGQLMRAFLKNITIIFFIVMLIMLKSRAAILGLLFATIYYFWKMSAKKKIVVILLSTVAIILTINYTNIPNYLLYNVLLNNRLSNGINAITSGRFDQWNLFIVNFLKQPYIGQGTYFIESFPLASLMSYGIIGSIPLFILSILPIFYVIKNNNFTSNSLNIRSIVIVLWLIIFSNGIFEELAPFGPGVKCYMLWFFTGLYIGQIYTVKKQIGLKNIS